MSAAKLSISSTKARDARSSAEEPRSPTHEGESEAHQIFRSIPGHAPAHRQRANTLQVPSDPNVIDSAAAQQADTGDHEPLPGIIAPGATG